MREGWFWGGVELPDTHYVDGNLRAQEPVTGSVNLADAKLVIGSPASATDRFRGAVDEVRIFDRALTPEELFTGFEIRRANFHVRTAQYLYVNVPGELTQPTSNKLTVTLTGDNGFSSTVAERSPIGAVERILLNHASLAAGNYVLTYSVVNTAGSTVDSIKERFSKPYAGVPLVGMDENNAFRVNGELFFPVTPFILNADDVPRWRACRYVNSLHSVGWYSEQNPTTWQRYLGTAKDNGMLAMGPTRGTFYTGRTNADTERNADTAAMRKYVELTRDEPGLFGWIWNDEPELGGYNVYVTAPEVAAWTYLSHSLDPKHPVGINLYGYDFLPEWGAPTGGKNPSYTAHYNRKFLGKAHPLWDFVGFDIYPLAAKDHPSLINPNQIMHRYSGALDNLSLFNGGLLPIMSFIEVTRITDIGSGQNNLMPSYKQIRMESWLNVVHGVKGINWFPFFAALPPENHAMMTELTDFITRLTPVVLAPDTGVVVTDDANDDGRRVDTLVRASGDDTRIIAVRITELNEQDSAPISVQFRTDALGANRKVIVPGELTPTQLEMHGSTSTARQMSFTLAQAPIRPGTLQVAGYVVGIEQNTKPADEDVRRWVYFMDDGAGSMQGFARSWEVRNLTGSVDYTTGTVTLDFGEMALGGGAWGDSTVAAETDMVRATYRPQRGDCVLAHEGNAFTDSFAPNTVRFYRLTATAGQPEMCIPEPTDNPGNQGAVGDDDDSGSSDDGGCGCAFAHANPGLMWAVLAMGLMSGWCARRRK